MWPNGKPRRGGNRDRGVVFYPICEKQELTE